MLKHDVDPLADLFAVINDKLFIAPHNRDMGLSFTSGLLHSTVEDNSISLNWSDTFECLSLFCLRFEVLLFEIVFKCFHSVTLIEHNFLGEAGC